QGMEQAVEKMTTLSRGAWELDALELDPDPLRLVLRLRGPADSLAARARRLRHDFGAEIFPKDEAASFWMARIETGVDSGRGTDGWGVVKCPLTPGTIVELEKDPEISALPRHYSMGGNVLWVSGAVEVIDAILKRQSLEGLIFKSSAGNPECLFLGIERKGLSARIKGALDPDNRFG
ncbi:MAG: hypothetical protein AAF591_17995, partial [Verrucomicrobiota bacterium]